MPLKLGLFSMTTGPCSYPEGAARVARAAEAAGFESLWTGEHVVLPDPQAPPSPVPPDHPMLDPAVAGGGCLRNLGPHGFDLFLFLTGEDAHVIGAQVSARALGQAVEDYASVLLRSASGVLGASTSA